MKGITETSRHISVMVHDQNRPLFPRVAAAHTAALRSGVMNTTTPPRPDEARISRPWVISIANGKGGTGKTTTCINLAAATEASSGRALVADLDPELCASETLDRVGDALSFDYLVTRDPSEITRIRDARLYDSIFLDNPGSKENQGVVRAMLKVTDIALVPCIPEVQALNPTLRILDLFREAGVEFRVVINQVDPQRGTRTAGAIPKPVLDLRDALDHRGIPYMRTYIRRYVAYPQSQLDGVLITDYRGDKSAPRARDDVRALHAELLIVLGRTVHRTAIAR